MLEKGEPSSPFVADMSTRVKRHAAEHTKPVVTFLDQPNRLRHNHTEQPLLDDLARRVEAVLATYDPPGIRREGDSLVFSHLYGLALRPPEPDHAPELKVLLAALIAAEVEFRGPLRLSRTQNHELAATYERLGRPLIDAGLPGHAALAFQRAQGLFRADEDTDAEDRCGLARARARRLAQPALWRRWGGLFPDLVCGYGYRPFRMLFWIALQLAVFTAAVSLVSDKSFYTDFYQVLVNYLNPLGPGDTEHLRTGGRTLMVTESYLGSVTMSVFFALLVRRWFRL